MGGSILHQRGRQVLSFLLTWGVLTHFTPPLFFWPCLLWPSSMSGHIHCGVHYPLASMGIDVIPSNLCTCSFQGLQSHHVTWGLHPSSVDAPVDIHGRSCNFPFFYPREALLVGHQVTALPLILLWCPLHFTSYRGSLAWGGTGTPVPCLWWLPIHKGKPTSDAMRRSQFWWRTHDLPCWFITL